MKGTALRCVAKFQPFRVFMSMPVNFDFTGIWEGSCTNITMGNVTAPLKVLISVVGDKIEGSLMVGGSNLGGSGRIAGVRAGDSLSFHSEGCENYRPMVWMGTMRGNVISGEYRVEPTSRGFAAGCVLQDGRFKLTKRARALQECPE